MNRRWPCARVIVFGASVLALWLVALPALARPTMSVPPVKAPFSMSEPLVEVDDAAAADGDDEAQPPPIDVGAARRAAPLCDVRGATGIAPSAVLVQDPMDSLDASPAGSECAEAACDNAVQPDAPLHPKRLSPDGDTAVLPASWKLVAGETYTLPPDAADDVTSPGARSRVERPPRS